MRPRFRFLYAALIAAATYGTLYALNAPRPWGRGSYGCHHGHAYGPGWRHGYHNRAGWGCAEAPQKADADALKTNAPADPVE